MPDLPASAGCALPADETIIESFLHVALRWESRTTAPQFVWKFPGRRIAFAVHPQGQPTPEERQELDAALARIAAAGGLTFAEMAFDPQEPLVPEVLLFVGGAREKAAATSFLRAAWGEDRPASSYGTCFIRPQFNDTDGIVRVVVYITRSRGPGVFARCVDEELLQAMGLPTDMPSHVGYSVFVDFGGSERATLHDYVLLAMLYDPRIRTGMREPEIEALASDVLVAAKARVLGLWRAAP